MKLVTTEEAYVLLIIFFCFLGCALNLVLKKKDDGLSAFKSLIVQLIGWCFSSLVLCLLFLGFGWNKWLVWVLGIPAGILLTRALVLLFEDSNKQNSLRDLAANVWETYTTIKNQNKGNDTNQQNP